LVAVPSLHVPPYRDPSLSESKGAFADAEEEEEEEEDEDIVTLTLLLKKIKTGKSRQNDRTKTALFKCENEFNCLIEINLL